MNRYSISTYSYGKAAQHNLKISPSLDPAKLIQVNDKHNNFVINIGDVGTEYFADACLTNPRKALLNRAHWQRDNMKKIRDIDEKGYRSEEYYINLLLN